MNLSFEFLNRVSFELCFVSTRGLNYTHSVPHIKIGFCNEAWIGFCDESAPIQFHLPPTPCFKHVENIDIAISSGWTPWGQETTSYASGEFVVGQVLNSKSELQEVAKIYSIRAHQEFFCSCLLKKIALFKM